MEGSMATLGALKFDTPDGAERMEHLLEDLEQQALLHIQDAAIVSWPVGAKKPTTRQLYAPTRMGTLDGAFWGLLFGLLFLVPVAGVALGAALGALVGHFTDVGIDDDFIKRVRAELTEGTSALFLLTEAEVPDRLAEELQKVDLHFTPIATELTAEEEARLNHTFAA
jgi:uncharacterized membrane protein